MHRFGPRGLYLLDEPEAALSPQGQLAFLQRLSELAEDACQLVVATHSPLLLAFPGARILELSDDGIQRGGLRGRRAGRALPLVPARPAALPAASRMTPVAAPFTPGLFTFLEELEAHNDRDWFQANKARYEADVREPALDFIEAFAPRLAELSPHLVAEPRSLFRIHRDTRFSKDKRPYKTHCGIFFRHERAKEAQTPGLYLHLAPGEVFCGGGIRHPDGPALARLRDRIAADPEAWTQAAHRGVFAERYRIWGEALKRAPAGYDPAHPLIEDLKRKEFIAITALEPDAPLQDGFEDELSAVWGALVPYLRFLGGALQVPI